jgi:hypothetical protein
LFPRDAVLNLAPLEYSWGLQRLAVMFCRSGSYEQAHELVLAVTGVAIGKRQLEQIAAGVAAFYAVGAPAGQDQPEPGEPESAAGPLGLSAGRRAKTPGERVQNFESRPGIGEKGHKRVAEVACVFDVIPAARTPEQVMAGHHGGQSQDGGKAPDKRPAPRAVNRRYRVDIAADRSAAICWLFEEAERRDPGHGRDWIALVDGDNHQIRLIQDQAAARGVPGITILIDLVHVIRVPVEGRLGPARTPRPGDRDLDHHPGAGDPARPRRPGHRPDHPARRRAAAAGCRARQEHQENPGLPDRQAALPGLPPRPGSRLARGHRRHRRRLPPPPW